MIDWQYNKIQRLSQALSSYVSSLQKVSGTLTAHVPSSGDFSITYASGGKWRTIYYVLPSIGVVKVGAFYALFLQPMTYLTLCPGDVDNVSAL